MWPFIAYIWNNFTPFRRFWLWLLNPKFTIGVNVLIEDQQNGVWLQQHRFWPQQQNWGLPGGFIKPGEDTRQAAVRELMEELGVQVDIGQLLLLDNPYSRQHVAYYRGIFRQSPSRLDNKEIIQAKFFPVNQLPEQLHPTHREIIRQYAHSSSSQT